MSEIPEDVLRFGLRVMEAMEAERAAVIATLRVADANRFHEYIVTFDSACGRMIEVVAKQMRGHS